MGKNFEKTADSLQDNEIFFNITELKIEVTYILDQLQSNNLINVSLIPNLDLYVDQVTNFIEENSFTNAENHLTKSMINNYTKNKVLPQSIKKKYNKNHILLLILIYNTKSILSISDIKKIFDVFTQNPNISKDKIIEFYTIITNMVGHSNINDIIIAIETSNELTLNSKKEIVSIIATRLAIEANNNKILSELLIEKYL